MIAGIGGCLVLCLVLLAGLPFGQAPAAGEPAAAVDPAGSIRVALLPSGHTYEVGATGGFEILDHAGVVIDQSTTGATVSVRADNGRLRVGQTGVHTGPLAVRPRGEASRVIGATRPYRGFIEIRVSDDGTLMVINEVGLEDYLLGVIAREMPSSWPIEALKAQAVAARTYGVRQMLAAARNNAPYAVLATTASQVYGGYEAETANTTAAVNETRGMVLYHAGSPISAVYHSSSGGHTENSEVVWVEERPYLRGVPDFDQMSPRYTWEKAMSHAEITLRVTARHDIGHILALNPAGTRGVSGRYSHLQFVGTEGEATVRSEDARVILGLRSTLFEANVVEDVDTNITSTMVKGQGAVVAGVRDGSLVTTTRPVGRHYSVGPEGVLYRMDSYAVVHRARLPGGVEFAGQGWGHGVGMSQWGAYQLARDGKTWTEILAHYYQGASLQQYPAAW